MKYTFGFIGCGNMGGALVRAVSKTVDGNKIAVCDYDQTKAQALATDLGVVATTATELAKESEFNEIDKDLEKIFGGEDDE